MSNSYFQFKQFTIQQDRCAMKVTTDACLFGGWVSEKVKNEKLKVKNIIDVGAGTGLLSLLFAQKNPNALIDAVEIDTAAYEQAKENIVASPWKDRITVINADVKRFAYAKKYDLIISNPPFYQNELKSGNDKKNVAHHSNELSLNNLFILTKGLFTNTGKFYFLFPYKRKEEIERSLKAHSFFIHEMILVRQSVKHDYFRIMIEGSFKKINEITTKEISIWNDRQQYTEAFIELLKDYYFYL